MTDIKIDIPYVYKKYVYNHSVGMYEKGYPINLIIKEMRKFFKEYYPEALDGSVVKDMVYISIYDYVMKQNSRESEV